MPRHLISDAHEWINEIPTVPIYYLAKPQPRERAWQNQRGKKTLNNTQMGSTAGAVKSVAVCILLVQQFLRKVQVDCVRDNLERGKPTDKQLSMAIPWRAPIE